LLNQEINSQTNYIKTRLTKVDRVLLLNKFR